MQRSGRASVAVLVSLTVVLAGLGTAAASLTDDATSRLGDLAGELDSSGDGTGDEIVFGSTDLLLTVDRPTNWLPIEQLDTVAGYVSPTGDVAFVAVEIRAVDGTVVLPMTEASIDAETGDWEVPTGTDLADGDYELDVAAVDTNGVATTKSLLFTIGDPYASVDGTMDQGTDLGDGSWSCPEGWEPAETGCEFAGTFRDPAMDGSMETLPEDPCGLGEVMSNDGLCAPVEEVFPDVGSPLDVDGGHLSADCGEIVSTRPECDLVVRTPSICVDPGYQQLATCIEGGVGFRTFCSDRPQDVLCAMTNLDGIGDPQEDGTSNTTPAQDAVREACSRAGADGPGVSVALRHVRVQAAPQVSSAVKATVPVGDEVVPEVGVVLSTEKDRAVCFRERSKLPADLPGGVVARCKAFQLEAEAITTGRIVEIERGEIRLDPPDRCRAEASAATRVEPELKLYHWTGDDWTVHDPEPDGDTQLTRVRSFSPFALAFADPGAGSGGDVDTAGDDPGSGSPLLGPISMALDWLELMPAWLLALVFTVIGAGGLGLGIRLRRRLE